jgi:diguanylate cyclase (GGDEF)-like protein
MVVEDTQQDNRFKNDEFVKNEPHIRFYMAHPVHSPDDHRIGTLCVFGSEPRKPEEKQKRILRDLAGIVDSEISRNELDIDRERLRENLEEAERRARIDGLTDLWNRRAVMDLLKGEINRSNRDELPIGIAMLDLDDFKSINDTYGHQAGDEALRATAERIRQSVRDYDVVGRYGGEEFIVVFPESNRDELNDVTDRIRRNISDTEIPYDDLSLQVTASIGISMVEPGEEEEPDTLIKQADMALYKAKELGKDRVHTFHNGD